jgi:hypothetical protein
VKRGLLFGAVLLLPGWARASNGAGMRTPPVYPQAACITNVDRSVDPMFHLDIGLAREDLLVTDDEPEDSRRFQFFVVCEDVHRDFLALPNWITVAEAQDAFDRRSIDTMPSDEDILERRDDLQGCVFPMNASDERIPISCEATEAGLDFDTRELPPGNYVVRGYTYEPPLNLWSNRRGVIRVFDDASAAPPSAGLRSPSFDGMQLRPGSPFAIEGCVAGADTLALQWASLIELGGDEAEDAWATFATLGGDGSFSVGFDPPADAVGQPLLVRAVAEGAGQRWVDHAEGKFLVFGDGGESQMPFGEPAEICGFYDPDDPPDPPGTTGGELTESGGILEPDQGGEDRAGCACSLEGQNGDERHRAGWLFLPLLVLRRRLARPA